MVRIDPVFGQETPLLFAHRGGAREVAESTRRGFRHAVRVGADVLELDIHVLDRDRTGRQREFVVWHGPGLSNVRLGCFRDARESYPRARTRSENAIGHWTWQDLQGQAWVADPEAWLEANGDDKPMAALDLTGVRREEDRLLMTLQELLEEFPEHHANIELKGRFTPADIEQLVALLDRLRSPRRVTLVTSARRASLVAFRRQSGERYPTGFSLPGVLAAWLGHLLPADMENRQALQTTCHRRFTPERLIQAVQRRQGAVHVFLTAFTWMAPAIDAVAGRPTREELFPILDRGVDGVMTDRPERVRGLIEAWRQQRRHGAPAAAGLGRRV
ncbi:MAG: glycerophosphodiester phosphodiesterase family protein [Thermodesulfobacteriota bacterium]